MTDVHTKTRVLVVGAGFGGIQTALKLSAARHFAVTILANTPYFSLFPAARTDTGNLMNPTRIPIAAVLASKRITFVEGNAERLDRDTKQVITDKGRKLAYDVLVLALGSVTDYADAGGTQGNSHDIRAQSGIRRLKDHVHRRLGNAHEPDLGYTIVGGGAAGVELAGSLATYLKQTMNAHRVKVATARIDLIETRARLLPDAPKSISGAVTRRLRRLGVKVHLSETATAAADGSVHIAGRSVENHTVIWTAGIANNPFFNRNGFKTDSRGRVIVDDYLGAEPDIYVIGDSAATRYSGFAQTALYDGAFVSDNLRRWAESSLMRRYEPRQPVFAIPVGNHWAAVSWGKLRLAGFAGWLFYAAAGPRISGWNEPWLRAGRRLATELSAEEGCDACRRRALRF